MKTLFYLPALLLVLLSCKKDDPLPAATQSGANTFGCRVDGRVWLPRNADLKSASTAAQYLEDERTLFIGAGINIPGTDEGIAIGISGFPGTPGFHVLDGSGTLGAINASFGRYRTLASGSEKYYFTDQDSKGEIRITRLDKANKIVSGTFSFKARLTTATQVVSITEGRFDMHYRDY